VLKYPAHQLTDGTRETCHPMQPKRFDSDDSDSSIDTELTRRRAVAGIGGVVLSSAGIIAATTNDARAQVTADFSVKDGSATLMQPPSAITIAVSGDWEVTASQQPEQVMQTLSVGVNGAFESIASDAVFDSSQGSYSLSGDALSHPDLTASALMPSGDATERATDITVRVTLAAVIGGETVAEATAEDVATVRITEQGVDVTFGGTGSVTVEA